MEYCSGSRTLLYSGQPDYRPEAFLVNDGEQLVCAISMVHVDPPLESEIDFTYTQKLRAVLGHLSFPVDHLPYPFRQSGQLMRLVRASA